MLLALLACVPDAPKSDTAPPVQQNPACQPDPDAAGTDLAWDDPGAGGYSAEDVLGFAVGTFTGSLASDDGATGPVTLEVTPEGAVQTITGPQSSCPVAIEGQALWSLATDDGRLAAGGDARWTVGDASYPPGGVSLGATLDAASVGFEPLASASTIYLRAFVDSQGTLTSVVVEEVWPLGADRNRVCVRASLDPAALACHDTGESTGPD